MSGGGVQHGQAHRGQHFCGPATGSGKSSRERPSHWPHKADQENSALIRVWSMHSMVMQCLQIEALKGSFIDEVQEHTVNLERVVESAFRTLIVQTTRDSSVNEVRNFILATHQRQYASSTSTAANARGISATPRLITDPSSRHMECGCRSPQRPVVCCSAAANSGKLWHFRHGLSAGCAFV